MARTIPLTADRITGEVQPLGYITGFAKPQIRSAWPTPRGKVLTSRRISMYAKQGYYVTNNSVTRAEKQKSKRVVRAEKAHAKMMEFV